MVLIPREHVERFVAVNPGDVVMFGCAAQLDDQVAAAVSNALLRHFGVVAVFTAEPADTADLTEEQRRDSLEVARGLVKPDLVEYDPAGDVSKMQPL